MSTQISDYVTRILALAYKGLFGDASELCHEMFDSMPEEDITKHMMEEELQFLDFIHGFNIVGEKYSENELQDSPLPRPSNHMAHKDVNKLLQCFFNQGKYPLGMQMCDNKKRVLYWYFQNDPTTTSVGMTIRDEVTRRDLWSGTVSHRDMAQIKNPDVNPYEFWSDVDQFEVQTRIMGYEAWKRWRKVNRV